MSPAISVLMPVYNAQRYVAAAVKSVLAQTFTDFELVLIDDGSTDGTLAILRDFAEHDCRVRLISRPNTGIVGALNEAIASARGEFFARMDADDICQPTRLQLQINYLRQHADCVLVGSNVMLMDVDASPIGPMPDVCIGHEHIDHALLRRGWPIVHPAVMMRAAAVKTVGGYLGKCPNEDHDLFLRLAEVGKIENLPQVLLYYRKHPSSITAVRERQREANVNAIVIDACRRRGLAVPQEITQNAPHSPKVVIDVQRVWAWQAMKHHNIGTARKYAFATLRHRPLSVDSWRLTFCAVRGH